MALGRQGRCVAGGVRGPGSWRLLAQQIEGGRDEAFEDAGGVRLAAGRRQGRDPGSERGCLSLPFQQGTDEGGAGGTREAEDGTRVDHGIGAHLDGVPVVETGDADVAVGVDQSQVTQAADAVVEDCGGHGPAVVPDQLADGNPVAGKRPAGDEPAAG